jgi:peptide/nickel transport system permease protein
LALHQLAELPGSSAGTAAPPRAGAIWWRSLRANPKAMAGLLLLLFFTVLAAVPGLIAPYNPAAEVFPRAAGPSARHLLGTTAYGQDVLSQLIWGTRESLLLAVLVGVLSTIISVAVGVTAAYLGGSADGILSLITDVILVIPAFPLIVVIAAYTKSANFEVLTAVLVAIGWSYGARQLRVQALSLRKRDFLEKARIRGERSSYIIVFEILPTMASLIVASFLSTAIYAVLAAAGLQFVGLGNPNAQSWGTMLYWAQDNQALQAGMPLWLIMPGVCIALLSGAFALLNYAFDEISNPSLRSAKVRHGR